MKNTLTTLPLEKQAEYLKDAQSKSKELYSHINNLPIEKRVIYLIRACIDLQTKYKEEFYFQIERDKLAQKELVDSYKEKIKEKDRIITNLIK